jgi:hypothetical protein
VRLAASILILLFASLVSVETDAVPSCRSLQYSYEASCLQSPGDVGCVWHADHPDLGPQIAVWIESADRARFIDTLMVTNATALFGIGNRPGLATLRSGPKFPYGRRPMALPIWAHARGKMYPLVVMQDGVDQMLTAHEGDSSPEPHFCRPMLPSEVVDAVTCPSGMFRSDKGRLDPTRSSVYPPRADLLDFGRTCPALVNQPRGSCDPGDSAQYAFLNDIDVVAAATPAFDTPSGGVWVIPSDLAVGDYALMVEVGKEFDSNESYALPNAESLDYDTFGATGNLGQPSVIFRVPFSVDATDSATATTTNDIFGYGDATGASGTISPPDETISTATGSGVGRLATTDGPGGPGRVHVALTTCQPIDCSRQGPPPPTPVEVTSDGITPTSAIVRIQNVADGVGPVLAYEVRTFTSARAEAINLSPSAFASWTPALMIPPRAPSSSSQEEIDGLVANSEYAVGVRARGRCGVSPVSYARFRTPPATFTQLKGCFIATAAFGSELAPEVNSLRLLRDRAVRNSGFARLAVDLYYRTSPALARPLSQTDVGRALVRRPLRVLATLARALLGD